MKDLHKLPDDLPVPVDDGVCDHLLCSRIPSIALRSVSDTIIDLGSIEGMAVIFFYPMIGNPESPPMVGWNDIPGARGCTPQSCSFRDNYTRFEKLGIKVFGVSSQALIEQKEASIRLDLPFELLNDSQFKLTKAMSLPTFQYESSTYIKRITVISENSVIKKTFYPVFPPDKNVNNVIKWLKRNKRFHRISAKNVSPGRANLTRKLKHRYLRWFCLFQSARHCRLRAIPGSW